MEIKERIKWARNHVANRLDKKITQAAFASMCGWDDAQTRIANYESGRRTPVLADFAKIAKAAGVRQAWLITEEGDPIRESWDKQHLSNTELGPELRRKVPVISWGTAGSAVLSNDLLATHEAATRMYCPVDHSEKTYALVVRDNSMTTSSSDSVPEGHFIFVDPEQRDDIVAGDFVVAKAYGQDAAVFRQLADGGEKLFLKPLNSQYPNIDEFEVLGRVIFAGRET